MNSIHFQIFPHPEFAGQPTVPYWKSTQSPTKHRLIIIYHLDIFNFKSRLDDHNENVDQ